MFLLGRFKHFSLKKTKTKGEKDKGERISISGLGIVQENAVRFYTNITKSTTDRVMHANFMTN